MKNKDNIIPEFKSEDEEQEFWATHSPLDYFEIKSAKTVSFPNLKPLNHLINILPNQIHADTLQKSFL